MDDTKMLDLSRLVGKMWRNTHTKNGRKMKTVFGLQLTSRDDTELTLTSDALKAVGLPFTNFGIIPFTDEITNLEEFAGVDKVLPLCGTKVLDMYLRPGTLPPEWDLYYSTELFDQSMYTDEFKKHMVNGDAVFDTLERLYTTRFSMPVFVKPSNDRKMFAGVFLQCGETLEMALAKTTHQELDWDEPVMVSRLKAVTNEYRLFVVDDKVVSASQYRNKHGLRKQLIQGNWLDRLSEYHATLNLQVPHPYVVDIAQLENQTGFSIMEFNCFNCSGMYAADRETIFRAIANYEGL